MVLKADQQRMKALLKETITLLCKNGLNYKTEFCIEALIGITLDRGDVFLVNINETIRDGLLAAKAEVECSEADTCADIASPGSAEHLSGLEAMGEERGSHSGRHRRRRRSKQDRPVSPPISTTPSGQQRYTSQLESEANSADLGVGEGDFSAGTDVFKTEEETELSSCRFQDSDAQRMESSHDNTELASKRTYPDEEESSSIHSASSKKHRHDDEDSRGSDDVVFIKDEPLSDAELEQVSLGIAHAQNQAIHELGYLPGSGESGESGQTESLPGCSNWPVPAAGGPVPAALGAPSTDHSQPSVSNPNSSLGQGGAVITHGHDMQQTQTPGSDGWKMFAGNLGLNSSMDVVPYMDTRGQFTCHHCNYSTNKQYNFQRHMRKHDPCSRITCKICGTSYVENYLLKCHLQVAHGIYVGRYRCDGCGEQVDHPKHTCPNRTSDPIP